MPFYWFLWQSDGFNGFKGTFSSLGISYVIFRRCFFYFYIFGTSGIVVVFLCFFVSSLIFLFSSFNHEFIKI